MINVDELKKIVAQWAIDIDAKVRIYLFGSQAKATADDQSDIDLAIEFLERISTQQMDDIVICDGVVLEQRIREAMGRKVCLEYYNHPKVKEYVSHGFIIIYESK